ERRERIIWVPVSLCSETQLGERRGVSPTCPGDFPRRAYASTLAFSTLPSNRHCDELPDQLSVVRVVQVDGAVEARRGNELLFRMVGDRVYRAADASQRRDLLAVADLVHADFALAVAR